MFSTTILCKLISLVLVDLLSKLALAQLHAIDKIVTQLTPPLATLKLTAARLG